MHSTGEVDIQTRNNLKTKKRCRCYLFGEHPIFYTVTRFQRYTFTIYRPKNGYPKIVIQPRKTINQPITYFNVFYVLPLR